jgi:phage terminase large subunit-like protein
MAVTARKLATPKGSPKPRIAPPTPARSLVSEFEKVAEEMGIDLMPSQRTAGRYLYAVNAKGNWLYPEVADLESRQNGKTLKLKPHIVTRLRMGRRIMHSAQNRDLPREVFHGVADFFLSLDKSELASRPRFANGQEEIRHRSGGVYRIVAPTRGGARGPSNDDLIIDEVRELDDYNFVSAAKPTLMASPNPQTLYLSNAGDDTSVVLNGIRLRGETDEALAYLEWSAAPGRAADDIAGWLESNPAIGHLPGVLDNLAREYNSHKLAGTLAIFETEHLCRWVASMRETLVDAFSWVRGKRDGLERVAAPALTVSMDPHGRRASVALAWQQPDGTIALRLLYNVTGNPIDTDALGTDIRDTARKLGVKRVGFDPLTDKELVKYITKPKPEPISGQTFANASAQFVNIVNADKLRWTDADAVTDDLTWTSRKPDAETGSYQAVRAQDDRPITASLAAIRAVWLASGPKPATPKVM